MSSGAQREECLLYLAVDNNSISFLKELLQQGGHDVSACDYAALRHAIDLRNSDALTLFESSMGSAALFAKIAQFAGESDTQHAREEATIFKRRWLNLLDEKIIKLFLHDTPMTPPLVRYYVQWVTCRPCRGSCLMDPISKDTARQLTLQMLKRGASQQVCVLLFTNGTLCREDYADAKDRQELLEAITVNARKSETDTIGAVFRALIPGLRDTAHQQLLTVPIEFISADKADEEDEEEDDDDEIPVLIPQTVSPPPRLAQATSTSAAVCDDNELRDLTADQIMRHIPDWLAYLTEESSKELGSRSAKIAPAFGLIGKLLRFLQTEQIDQHLVFFSVNVTDFFYVIHKQNLCNIAFDTFLSMWSKHNQALDGLLKIYAD